MSMKPDKITTAESFITERLDVTIKPTRYQSEVAEENKKEVSPLSAPAVPQMVTIERAIKFYEENAKGDLAQLYKFTALKLREILKTPTVE